MSYDNTWTRTVERVYKLYSSCGTLYKESADLQLIVEVKLALGYFQWEARQPWEMREIEVMLTILS